MDFKLLLVLILTSSCAINDKFNRKFVVDQPDIDTSDLISRVEREFVKEQNEQRVDIVTATSSSRVKTSTSKTPAKKITKVTEEVEDKEEDFLDEKQMKSKAYHQWVKYFTKKGKERFQRHINNGQRQRQIIEKIFADYGLPKDLFYVGLIESGYNTYIKSHANAVGPWQFIRGTAKRYGLTVNSSIDERSNIYKATEASAKYFQDLYNIFGGWELALCAYNSGEYRVINAIVKGNTRNLAELIEKKLLPRETRNYVPKVLAAKHIVENGRTYGFNIPTSPKAPNLKEYKVYRRTNISALAKSLGVSKSTLRTLNPDLKRHNLRFSSSRGLTVFVPKTARALASARSIFSRPAPLKAATPSKRFYTVRKGDSLLAIANKHSSSLNQIMRWNKLSWKSTIYSGQRLIVESHQQEIYRVRKGDNLSKIARKHSLSLKELLRKNNLTLRSKIYPGQRLAVGDLVPTNKRKIKRVYYKVRKGDTLSSIARRFHISVHKIMRANKMSSSRLFANKTLIIPRG